MKMRDVKETKKKLTTKKLNIVRRKRRIKEYQFVVEWELKTYSTTHNCELNKNF
jgi:hypothetical protein